MSEVTLLLEQWRAGDPQALDNLMATVYGDLKKLATARLRREPAYHTLQPTALIHEYFFRLVAQDRASLKNRDQFFALAARIMRRILMDHARGKQAVKRGGQALHLGHDVEALGEKGHKPDPVMLDEALVHLAQHSPELCLLVELKHFGGFSMDEICQILDRPQSSVYRMWKLAKARLFQYYRGASHDS